MCGVFKNVSGGRSEQEWPRELGLSRAGAHREARHQKYSLNSAEAQIGPGRKGGKLKSKRELENNKSQSAGATWTRQCVEPQHIFILLRIGLLEFSISHHDTKLLWLRQPRQQVVSNSCDGASGLFNHQQRGSEWDYWNAKASAPHVGQRCGPFETQGPGMNISCGTEQNKCDDVPTLDLRAAWMWNCGVGGSCRNDPLKDKQAAAANVTPQRVQNFHRGLSNVVYLFCVNCSDVWSAVTLNWGITLLWG